MTNASVRQPTVFVLAGVNGAGKSSIGGGLLKSGGVHWFNPDDYARELKALSGCSQEEANAKAWVYGKTALETSIRTLTNFAFETTLGGKTIPALLMDACATHAVIIWFCGLASVEKHIERVRQRVVLGGHDIPEEKIRTRWDGARSNLIRLIPRLHALQVFDNSVDADPDGNIPDPRLLLDYKHGVVHYPSEDDAQGLAATPGWARPILQAAFLTNVSRRWG